MLERNVCFKVDPCIDNNGGCSHICVNGNGKVSCRCPEGQFLRKPHHSITITDIPGFLLENSTQCSEINGCLNNNGNCSHYCEFMEHQVLCSCPDMHTLVNQTQCVENNLCEIDNGGCSHLCEFKDHKILCTCPDTHQLHNDTHCVLKNPCLSENGGCSHQCLFENG